MICPRCGASLEEGLTVCPDCGQTVEAANTQGREGYLSSSMEYTPGEALSRKRSKSTAPSRMHRERGSKRAGKLQSVDPEPFESGPASVKDSEGAFATADADASPLDDVQSAGTGMADAKDAGTPLQPAAEEAADRPDDAKPPEAEIAADGKEDSDGGQTTQDAEPAAPEQEPAEPAPGGEDHIDLTSTLHAPEKTQEPRSFWKRFVKWLCIFLAIAAVGVAAHMLVTKNFVTWQRFFNTIFGKEVDAPYVPAAIMELSEKDGKYLRTFSVYGENNYKLIVDSLGEREVQFRDGVARVTIEDSVWISEEPDPNLEYLEVNLKMRVMDDLGYSTDVEVDPFLVYVPQTPVEFDFPTSDVSRVYEETAALVFAPPENSRVSINGDVVPRKVDESGKVRYEMPVEMGDNAVTFEATMPFARPLSKTFNIRRTLHDVDISLSQAAPSRTEASYYTITGVVESGAKLSTSFPGSGITLNKSTGKFSFTASLQKYGLHNIVIHAVKDGREPSDLVVSIERIPNPRTFASAAISPDVKTFIASPGSYKDKNLYFDGMVERTDRDHHYELLVDGQTIGFTYHGTTNLRTGDKIRIYGNYASLSENQTPQLSVWFITK